MQWDDDVNQRLVAATDVNKVVYRLNESALAVKIRVFHTKTLKDTERHHRAVTTFTHNDDHYRLTSTLDAAALYVLEDNAWTRVHHGTMSANGGDGQMMVKFPVSALGTAFVMQDLRTRLVVTGTSIVDRTATNKDLPVYPPR